MGAIIEGLSVESLRSAHKRLKKDTKRFTRLIVRDPVDFVDFDVNLDTSLSSLVARLEGNQYYPKRPQLHPSPKGKGINRPTVVFDVEDAVVYRFCVEQIEDQLFEAARQNNIRGGIKITPINDGSSEEDFYEKWFKDWTDHISAIEESLEERPYLVTTDIASYFEYINILLLKDQIRSDVPEKKGVMNLLFYFLESSRFRDEYEVNTFTGLLQEDIDCSRILAYYFLHPHDERMKIFCRDEDAEFFRFVDDMSVSVRSEVDGRKALRFITESLRKLNLVASIEKTSILPRTLAQEEMFFQENQIISDIEFRIKKQINEGQLKVEELNDVIALRKKIENEKGHLKNWVKILKRLYTIATYSRSQFLFEDVGQHLISFPDLFAGARNKIGKYLISLQDDPEIEQVLIDIIDYLYSDENLYPAVETSVIETLLTINRDSYSSTIADRIKELSWDIIFQRNEYTPNSEYARGLSCLLLYRFDRKNVDVLAEHYLKADERDKLMCKYLVFVCLTTKNNSLRQSVLAKAREELDRGIHRLVNLVDNIGEYANHKAVKNYLKNQTFYISVDPKVEIPYTPVRAEILNELIEIYSK